MAEVTSFTAARILELVAQVEAQQRQIEDSAAQVNAMRAYLDEAGIKIDNFNNLVAPDLTDQVNNANAQVGNVVDGMLPPLQQQVSDQEASLVNLNTVLVPNLQQDIASMGTSVNDMKQTFRQPDEPLDEEWRALQLGDEWFDTDDLDASLNPKKYYWTGTEWLRESMEVADFSLVVTKFKTNTHMLY